jgi:hypothetical protein
MHNGVELYEKRPDGSVKVNLASALTGSTWHKLANTHRTASPPSSARAVCWTQGHNELEAAMISLHSRSLLPSVFLCLLTTSGTAALGSVPHDGHCQNQGQDEPRQSQPPQSDQQDQIRRPVVYIMESGWRPGIVPGFVISPSSPAGLRPEIYEAFRTAASLRRMAVDVTIYPDQADYILALDVSSYPWSSWQTWTLVNARSGIVLRQERGLLLQNALRDAIGVIGRLWSAQQQSVQRP